MRSNTVLRRGMLVVGILTTAGFAALTATGATAAPRGLATDSSFVPSTLVTNLDMTVRNDDGSDVVTTTTLHRRGPEQYREVATQTGEFGFATTQQWTGSTYFFGDGRTPRLRNGQVARNHSTIDPDGRDPFSDTVLQEVLPLITAQRSGKAALVATTLDGAPVLEGTTTLFANECGGAKAGVRTVDLDPATLLPVRIVDQRRRTHVLTQTFTSIAATASDFETLQFRHRPASTNERYTRRSTALAARTLPFTVSLPSYVPAGFALEHTEAAPKSNLLGPEGSFPAANGVFGARWVRGVEPLDLTIRGARGTLAKDWAQSDPSGVECGTNTAVQVRVNGVTGHYALDDYGTARLWWGHGKTLYMLSGAYPASELVKIANSLSPVRAGA